MYFLPLPLLMPPAYEAPCKSHWRLVVIISVISNNFILTFRNLASYI